MDKTLPFTKLLVLLTIVHAASLLKTTSNTENLQDEPTQSWAYVTVRPKAHMFYWLYQTTHSKGYRNRPLILWLQGGPGGSGTGFGNFMELGPLDANLNPRNTTWLQTASLLFIDNPVGTGYSYVEEGGKFTRNVAEISADLLTCMQAFVSKHQDYKKVPFYIFSESYGGKMAAAFSAVLYQAIQDGKIQLNFKGFAMGDSWISPVDSTNSWGPYLYSTSLVDKAGLNKIQKEAAVIADLMKNGQYGKATDAWSSLEDIVEETTGGVNFYNIMHWGSPNVFTPKKGQTEREKFYERHIGVYYADDLDQLMNGVIRKKLKIIPDNVTWGGQSGRVGDEMRIDFMRNVTATVNHLVMNTPLIVVAYEGQLDLICDVLGAYEWFYSIDIAKPFWDSPRKHHPCKGKEVCYYSQNYKNLRFYWILEAGHMVPADNGWGALDMVNDIIGE